MRARGLLAALVMVSIAACSSSSPMSDLPEAPVSGPTPTASPTGPATTAVPDGHDFLDEDLTPDLPQWSSSAQEDAVARAEGFVRAWARPDLDSDAWFAGVLGYLSPAAAEVFIWTDPSFVPATAVTGPAWVVGEGTGTSVVVGVPTDAGDLTVTLIKSSEATPWLVADLAAPDTPDGGFAP